VATRTGTFEVTISVTLQIRTIKPQNGSQLFYSKLNKKECDEMVKREIFDRYQPLEVIVAGTQIIHDDTLIPAGYKRVYTIISANSGSRAPGKIRFGLGFENRNHFYEEEQNPAQNVYYNTDKEYHCKGSRKGVVAVHDLQVGDLVVVNWHGYEIKVEED